MAGKVMIVTGAFGTLGRVVAARAAAEGWRIVAIDHSDDAPRGFGADIGAEPVILTGIDLTDAATAAKAIDEAATTAGRIDALVNIAGGFAWETLGDGSVETWQRLYATNLLTALHAAHASIPYLTKAPSARIVSIGANAAVHAAIGMGAYAASKAGVHRLTETLADELKGKVTVNAVLPSIIDTPANRADIPDADPATWVTPDELASVILFLASDAASAVIGALIPVTGRV
jgi:NAD(P)-dependent dehydrogenase (short-subunit alcohol dehydrogenase family)